MSDETPSIPQMGEGGKKGGPRPGSGRPSKADLDERAAGLDMREQELADREAQLSSVEANPPPVTPVTAEGDGKGANPKASGATLGHAKRLDAKRYVEKYPNKTLAWVNDMNGDVQRWLDAGAEPVPVEVNHNRAFEGITDRVESKWVRAVGGDDGMGGHFWVYLLMMDSEVYDRAVKEPVRERQAAIKRAMSRGKDQSGGEGGELESYAPHLPTGGRGFEQVQDHLTGKV